MSDDLRGIFFDSHCIAAVAVRSVSETARVYQVGNISQFFKF